MFILLFAACGAPEPAERAPEPAATGRTLGPLLEGDPPLACEADARWSEPCCVITAASGLAVLAPFDGQLIGDTHELILTEAGDSRQPGESVLHLWTLADEPLNPRQVTRGEVIGHIGATGELVVGYGLMLERPTAPAYEAGRWPTGYALPELRAD